MAGRHDDERGPRSPLDDPERLRELVRASPDLVASLTSDGAIEQVNPAGLRLLGIESGVAQLPTRLSELYPPWAAALVRDEGLVVAARDGTWSGQSALLHADGSEIPVSQLLVAHRSETDGVCSFSTVCRDLRSFQQAERAVAASESRYRAFVEGSPMGIHAYELTADGRLVFVGANPGADRILGVENASFIGKTIEEAFPPLAATEVPRRYREAAEHGRLWHTEQIAYDHGRIKGAYEVYAFQTGPRAMAAMFLDITERKQAEAARERLEEQLRQSQKMEALGRLAGGVAHDFNNILTAIAGYAQQLQLSLPAGDPRQSEVREIVSAADRAARLTRQLLSFSRKQLVVPRVLDANQLIAEAQQMFSRIIGEDVLLEFRPGAEPSGIRVDPSQLEQVLINLVVNARDAMPNGGSLLIETANVERASGSTATGVVPGLPGGRMVLLTIRDTGVGMTAETLEHVFEPFFSTKEPTKGTGLGLATVYGIVQQSGGQVEVESALGRGTTFRIYFPAAEAAATPAGVEAPRAAKGSETILVVEDDARVRELCIKLLERQGYRVLSSESGAAALAAARRASEPASLLLTDVVMPGMNGKELYRELKGVWPGLKVLYMSGFDEQVVARHGVLAEGTHLLQKPFTIAALGTKIRAVLDER